MYTIPFDPADSIQINIESLSPESFDWAVGIACGATILVEIEANYDGAWITTSQHFNAFGEPKNWSPRTDWVLIGPEIFARKVATYTKKDGDTWYARSFKDPSVIYSDSGLLEAACKVMIYEHFGDLVSAPRQLQEMATLRKECLALRRAQSFSAAGGPDQS